MSRDDLPRVTGKKSAGPADSAFEVICRDRGDHPYLDYSQLSLRLQRLRGPYNTIEASLAAYEENLGLTN